MSKENFFSRLLALKADFPDEAYEVLSFMLLEGEEIAYSFKSVRDRLVFTDKRLIAYNSQGLSGKKRDYFSIALNKITAFSCQSAGLFEMEQQLKVWLAGVGEALYVFAGTADLKGLCRHISRCILN